MRRGSSRQGAPPPAAGESSRCVELNGQSIEGRVERGVRGRRKASRMNFNYLWISSPTHVTFHLRVTQPVLNECGLGVYKLQHNTAPVDHQTKSKTRRGNLHSLTSGGGELKRSLKEVKSESGHGTSSADEHGFGRKLNGDRRPMPPPGQEELLLHLHREQSDWPNCCGTVDGRAFVVLFVSRSSTQVQLEQ